MFFPFEPAQIRSRGSIVIHNLLLLVFWFLKGGVKMSLPNIPNIKPNISIDRKEAINLLLASVAMEEISLSHILNAEGEKLQQFLKTCPDSLNDMLMMNNSINQTLRTVIQSQIMLQIKLEDILSLDKKNTTKHDSSLFDSFSSSDSSSSDSSLSDYESCESSSSSGKKRRKLEK